VRCKKEIGGASTEKKSRTRFREKTIKPGKLSQKKKEPVSGGTEYVTRRPLARQQSLLLKKTSWHNQKSKPQREGGRREKGKNRMI